MSFTGFQLPVTETDSGTRQTGKPFTGRQEPARALIPILVQVPNTDTDLVQDKSFR